MENFTQTISTQDDEKQQLFFNFLMGGYYDFQGKCYCSPHIDKLGVDPLTLDPDSRKLTMLLTKGRAIFGTVCGPHFKDKCKCVRAESCVYRH